MEYTDVELHEDLERLAVCAGVAVDIINKSPPPPYEPNRDIAVILLMLIARKFGSDSDQMGNAIFWSATGDVPEPWEKAIEMVTTALTVRRQLLK